MIQSGTLNRLVVVWQIALNVSADEYVLNDINNDLVNLYGQVTDANDDTFIQVCASKNFFAI